MKHQQIGLPGLKSIERYSFNAPKMGLLQALRRASNRVPNPVGPALALDVTGPTDTVHCVNPQNQHSKI